MEWVLGSRQFHSTFSNLGVTHADKYHVNENCNAALETILHNILTEDEYLRTYRRSINFGQNIQKDLIPVLIHAKEDKTIELIVTILVNLSTPIECLLSVEETLQSHYGSHTVFEINQLLAAIKAAFTEPRATKVIVDILKKNATGQPKLSSEQCTNISNSLLLLRNILHIPGDPKSPSKGTDQSLQNQILWNIFSESIDKVLIKLITMPEATNWAVTMVQLIALFYKDQHVVTLHKLMNIWLESCNSESSEDNESNTSPRDRGNANSSPILTSDPASDSSNTGDNEKRYDEPNSENNGWRTSSENATMMDANQPLQPPLPDENDIHMNEQNARSGDDNMKSDNDDKVISESSPTATTHDQQPEKTEKKAVKSETSDCGYGRQIEDQDSISTSSNDEEVPSKKPVHQKPHNPKQRVNTKARTGLTIQEKKRKKIVKRVRANIINVKGLHHQSPTDDDISNVLKEFTVDFLMKGYNSLVKTIHTQVLNNILLEFDTSHFFWLVTYFLKFATQIELDLEQISAILSFDIVSYLTAEGVNLCEQFELAVKLDGNDLKPSSRRLHLVVTAIRELVQAIEVYKKFPHLCDHDRDALLTLENKICETVELRLLLVLLLRYYNPKYHTKQYLQDLIVTNHILMTFVDDAMRSPDYNGSSNMTDHIKQFATSEIMCQYGLLLEDYEVNGEFINDCAFTMMHHVGGGLDSLITLYQPKILKTFTSIWKSEFELCDDWTDLIEYVINTFIKKPQELLIIENFRMDTQIFEDEKFLADKPAVVTSEKEDSPLYHMEKKKSAHSNASQSSKEKWTENYRSSLSWFYLKCHTLPDVVGAISKCLKENGTVISRDSVIEGLYQHNIINKGEYEKLSNIEVKTDKGDRDAKTTPVNTEIRDVEIGKLCEQLRRDGKTKCFDWVQQVLLETCYAKLQIEKRYRNECFTSEDQSDIPQFKLFNQEYNSPVMSPVSYHALHLNQPVPLVPWNCEQAAMCKDLKFLQLLHRLGFQMPVDTGKVFMRIPPVWPADVLYEVAGRVAIIDTTKLKFSISDIPSCRTKSFLQQCNTALPTDLAKDVTSLLTGPENIYQIHKQRHLAAIVNFAPRPGSSVNSDIQNEVNKRSWLEVVQQSQELKLTCAVRDCETVSVASDLTHMYISDEDEKLELELPPNVSAKPIKKESSSDTERVAVKRPRLFDTTF